MNIPLSEIENQQDEKRGSLIALFEPRSVAVIGASDDPGRIGGRPLRYLKDAGFSGPIYPVNPNRDTVQALPAYRTVSAITHTVDLAIIALPAERVVEELIACAEKGVKAVIVFSSGFAETDDEGAARQHEIRRIARRSGMRILGPNCLGAFNAKTGFFGTFAGAFDNGAILPGPISIASQSGACGGHLSYLCKQRGIGIHYWVTTGNEADVDVSECILWLAQSEDVKVIVVYAEGIRDGTTFIRALETARRSRKPVIMLPRHTLAHWPAKTPYTTPCCASMASSAPTASSKCSMSLWPARMASFRPTGGSALLPSPGGLACRCRMRPKPADSKFRPCPTMLRHVSKPCCRSRLSVIRSM